MSSGISHILNLISQNPFRILGVTVNAPKKEIIANANKIKAFLKVGKELSTGYDLTDTLAEAPIRTEAKIEWALRELNLPIDQLKWSLFWIASTSAAEEISVKNLAAGQVDKAIHIVEKFATWSAFLDFHTLSFIQRNLPHAAFAITALSSDEYRDALLKGLGCETLPLSQKEILYIYFDELSKEIEAEIILNAFVGLPTYEIIKDKAIEGYVEKLNRYVDVAKSTKKDEPLSNLNAGMTLIRQSSSILEILRRIANGSTVYNLVSDRVALQVEQNGVDYYNETADEDAPRKAIVLFDFALKRAVGQTAKQHCQANYDLIKNDLDLLPPLEVVSDFEAIEQLLAQFGNNIKSVSKSKELVFACSVFLGNIKEKGSLMHPAIIELTTGIVRKALSSVVGDINNALAQLNKAEGVSRFTALRHVKSVLKEAWEITLCLDKLPIDQDSKDWYGKNRSQLLKLLSDVSISPSQYTSFAILTEPEYFKNCKTKLDFQNYLKRYANPRYRDIAKSRIVEFERQEIAERQKREALLVEIKKCGSIEALLRLKSSCTDAMTRDALDEKGWNLCKTRIDFENYVQNFPNGKHKTEAQKKARKTSAIFNDFVRNHKGWIIFIGIVIVALIIVGLIWGPSGYRTALYILGGICVFVAWGGLSSEEGSGCVAFIICGIIAAACFLSANYMDDYVAEYEKINKEKRIYNQFVNNPSEENTKEYLRNWEDGPHSEEIISIYVDRLKSEGPVALVEFSNTFPVSAEKANVKVLVAQLCDSLYNVAVNTDTQEGWVEYQAAVPTDEFRDSQNKIEAFENRGWNTESKAWAKASELNSLAGYYKYINLYPNGAHSSRANKKIIDMAVDNVMAGSYSKLPSLDQTSYGYGPTSSISVFNNTSYTLNLLYSGPDSKRISIAPHGRRSITLKNGSYRCVAFVVGGNVSNYAGTENLKGGNYEVEYYISTYTTKY